MIGPKKWDPKWLREAIVAQQTYAPDSQTSCALGLAVIALDYHRPLGPDGAHGVWHTPTCGCEDVEGSES